LPVVNRAHHWAQFGAEQVQVGNAHGTRNRRWDKDRAKLIVSDQREGVDGGRLLKECVQSARDWRYAAEVLKTATSVFNP
jgi:hypothetical protein